MTVLYLLIWALGCIGIGVGIFDKHPGSFVAGSFAMVASSTAFLGFQHALGVWLLTVGVVKLLDWVAGRP